MSELSGAKPFFLVLVSGVVAGIIVYFYNQTLAPTVNNAAANL